jgi:DNA-binding response OmpR family regulator
VLGAVTVKSGAREVTAQSRRLHLTPKEFDRLGVS